MVERTPTLSPEVGPQRAGLLSTKLHVPPQPTGFVARPRLVERLDRGLARGVVLVSAGAGFGKSVAVADWCRRTRAPVAWLSLDDGDNDPVRFWRHAAAALDRALGGAGLVDVVERSVVGPEGPKADGIATAVLNAVAASPRGVVVVLDDHHVIEDARVHADVGFLIAHAPPGLRLALVTRRDPPLPLARLRSRGLLTDIREPDLRFTAGEAVTLLRGTAGAGVSDDAAAALTARTEGWAAGLQLAGLSLRGRTDVGAFLTAFSGSHRYVLDYLTEEVLDRQPMTLRAFLLRTSVLAQLSGPLCDAVTGRTDSAALLETVERANLFCVPLDDVRGWWRYHHLFAELLRARLRREFPGEVQDLHRRAAKWHEANGLAEEAVRHALAAGDPARAARVIERHADELLLRSRGATLLRLLAELPDLGTGSRRLLLARARADLYAGRLARARRLLAALGPAPPAAAERSFQPSVDTSASPLADPDAMTTLLRAFVAHLSGDPAQAEALATRTLERLDDGQSALTLIARWHLAAAAWLRGAVQQAEPAFAANVAQWRAARQPDRAAWVAHHLARVQLAQGRLDAAVRTYERVLAEDTAEAGPDAPVAGIAQVGLAEVAFQRNDLDAAHTLAREGIARCRRSVSTLALAAGLTTLAGVLRAQGETSAAHGAVTEAVEVGPDAEVVDLLSPAPARRATMLLADGRVEEAATWLIERGIDPDDDSDEPPRYVRLPADLVSARVLLARGRAGDALRLLGRLGAAAAADGRVGDTVAIEALRAVALATAGDRPAALQALAGAVASAAPRGYVRIFVDEGGPMAALLGELIADPDAASRGADGAPIDHLGVLTRAFDEQTADVPEAAAVAPGRRQHLVVPLTAREVEVLQLVATGRQNKEIARDLHVSLNTVKKHVTHILDKVGATNRTAATDRARELGLLG